VYEVIIVINKINTRGHEIKYVQLGFMYSLFEIFKTVSWDFVINTMFKG